MRVSVDQACALLSSSHPVAIPTETVWGLAASLNDEQAVGKIFSLKGRPLENPLIVHLSHIEELYRYAQTPFPPHTEEIANSFWPGPLTIVIPCKEDLILPMARAGLPSAGFRVPRNRDTRKLLQKTGPLVAPSANLSGRPSATDIRHVEEDFGLTFPCVDSSENCECGVESTIVLYDHNQWRIGRLGAIRPEQLAPILGYIPLPKAASEKPLCPGQKFRHYAPRARLTLSRSLWSTEYASSFHAVVGFEDRTYLGIERVFTFGSSKSPRSVETALYRTLRALDAHQIQHAWIDCAISYTPQWDTVIDRLIKASAG